MNKYILNEKITHYVIISIIVISIILCVALHQPINYLSSLICRYLIDNSLEGLTFIVYCFQPISFSFISYILWVVFDKWLWKILFKRILPNINGVWLGQLVANEEKWNKYIVMDIKQTFSSISIKSYFANKDDSLSLSSTSSGFDYVISKRNSFYYLSFSYTNNKHGNESNEIEHRGFNYFQIQEDYLLGNYTTFRAEGRTWGTISVRKSKIFKKYKPEIWDKAYLDN